MTKQKLLKRKNKALAERNNDLLLKTCIDLADLCMKEGNYEEALENYKTIANLYKEQNKIIDYALAQRGIGDAYLGLHNFDKAIKHLYKYLELARKEKNKLEEQRALANIGHAYLTGYLENPDNFDKNNLLTAYNFFKQSLNVCERLNGEISKFDYADMSARLFCNLGLAQDGLGNYEQALELLNKSVIICKNNDIYEQLQRGYECLASLFDKKKDYNDAILNYNLAIEVSKKLQDVLSLMCFFSAKASILVKLGDLQSAKNILLKAYRLKNVDVSEKRKIESNLRVVAAMTYAEKNLLNTDAMDYENLKQLYEKLGDGACFLKSYDRALAYYKKMLESAQKAEMQGRELSACYFSIAQTHRDNNQFDEAVVYYEMEYDLCRNNLKDGLDSLCNIADTKEASSHPVEQIKIIYERAVENCRKEGNKHEEGRMLKRYMFFLKRQNRLSEVFQLEKKFNDLDYVSSDESDVESDIQNSPNIGDEINVDDITDDSDNGDADQFLSVKNNHRRNKNFKFKPPNKKGETELHLACIDGKLNVVRHLLQLGHPVNVRDHCGWLPLHEACNKGHYDIVELLLEKGAAINDRGGTGCGGITPLYDAASNGHLTIVELLLNKGASAVVKTDDGETVLEILKKWRENAQLDDTEENLYQSLIKRISPALDKVVQSPKDTDGKIKKIKSLVSSLETNENNPQNQSLKKKDFTRNRSSLIDLDEEIDNFPTTSKNFSSNNLATVEYKSVMENLRRSNKNNKNSNKFVQSINKRPSALISENEFLDDDWLEDDLGNKNAKKRKVNPTSDTYVTTFRSRTNTSPSKITQNKSISRESENEVIEIPSDAFDSDFEVGPPLPPRKRLSSGSKSQKTLIDSGFTREKNSPTNYFNKNQNFGRKIIKKQAKVTSFATGNVQLENADSSLTQTNVSKISTVIDDPTLFVDVLINERLYRVPVLLSQVNTRTIRWLAEEAAIRYAKKEYVKPTLELESRDGAVLADDDLLSLLFPMGALQAEQVRARVIKWNLLPLNEKYKEVCSNSNAVVDESLCAILGQFSTCLDLSDGGFRGDILAPLCKALNRQSNLLELDLSGNFLSKDCQELLWQSLPSLHDLTKLSLSCANLSDLRGFAECLSQDGVLLKKLSHLDLGDNSLDDRCFNDLAIITGQLKLKKLILANNRLTRSIFDSLSNRTAHLTLKFLEELDLNGNQLNNEAIAQIVSWTDSKLLRNLNIARNLINDNLLRKILDGFGDNPISLRILNLSRCKVQDSEVFNLLRLAVDLEVLDLSYNCHLSGITLRRLLQIKSLKEIKLFGCDDIFKYFEDYEGLGLDVNNEKSLKISLDGQEAELLEQVWSKMYGDRGIVEKMQNFMHLSIE